MSSIYEKNMEALGKHHPDLLKTLEERLSALDLRPVMTSSGHVSVTVQTPSGEIPLHDPADPVAEARKVLADAGLNHPKVVFFLGLGLGYALAEFVNTITPDVEFIVIVEEHPEIFQAALTVHDFSSLLGSQRVRWFVGEAAASFRQHFYDFMLPVKMMYYEKAIDIVPVARCLDPGISRERYYEDVMKALQEGLEYRHVEAAADPEDSLIGLHNILANARNVYRSPNVDSLKDVFRGVPGVLIASGPSLDAVEPCLKGITGRALTVCVASVARRLLRSGFSPHVIAAIERDPRQTMLLDDLETATTRLLAPPLVEPSTYDIFRGPVVSILRSVKLFDWFPSPFQKPYIGSTSALLGYYFLLHAGCDPILLIGNDMALHPETGSTHADRIYREERLESVRAEYDTWKRIPAEGNNGRFLMTTEPWIRVRNTFERYAREWKRTLINVIPADFGVRIPGATRMDPMDLRKVLRQEWPIEDRLQNGLKSLSSAEVAAWEMRLKERLRASIEDLERLREKLRVAAIEPSYAAYQECHEGSDGRVLLYDIFYPVDLDVMAAYHALPREGLQGAALEAARQGLLRKGLESLGDWNERVLKELVDAQEKIFSA